MVFASGLATCYCHLHYMLLYTRHVKRKHYCHLHNCWFVARIQHSVLPRTRVCSEYVRSLGNQQKRQGNCNYLITVFNCPNHYGYLVTDFVACYTLCRCSRCVHICISIVIRDLLYIVRWSTCHFCTYIPFPLHACIYTGHPSIHRLVIPHCTHYGRKVLTAGQVMWLQWTRIFLDIMQCYIIDHALLILVQSYEAIVKVLA